MREHTTILVPIHYPLTEASSRTLAAAGRVAYDRAPADLIVLHVNLFQTDDNTQSAELARAISSTLNDVKASVITRRGFLVEEVILEEASQTDADIVVVGANQQSTWRHFLRRLLQGDPDVGSFLHKNTTEDTEIMEVDAAAKTPAVEPV